MVGVDSTVVVRITCIIGLSTGIMVGKTLVGVSGRKTEWKEQLWGIMDIVLGWTGVMGGLWVKSLVYLKDSEIIY